MNILVTGGAGYIGSVCSAALLSEGHTVVTYDDLRAGHKSSVSPGVHFVEANIADKASLSRAFREFDIEAVMHFAASALIDESIRNPALFYRNNVSGSLCLLETMAEHSIKKLVFSSTAAVYGEPEYTPIDELHSKRPVNAYGETKLVIERALPWFYRAYGIRSAAMRYFNACGSAFGLGEHHEPETHLLPLLLRRAFNPDAELIVFGDDYPTKDGTCVRDFVHVADIAQAHSLALQALESFECEAFNVGSGSGYTIMEVIACAEKVTGKRIKVRIGDRRSGDPAVLTASPEKLVASLGWRPQFSSLEYIIRSALDPSLHAMAEKDHSALESLTVGIAAEAVRQ
jgi:UDP-glucose 4-epimerase